MIRLVPITQDEDLNFRWWKDVDIIINVCKQNGYIVSKGDARKIWENYSDSVAASWLILPEKDEDIMRIILLHSRKVETL